MLTTQLERTWRGAWAAEAALRVRNATEPAARAAAERLLAERLGRLRGLPQKVGQMLSFSWKDDLSTPSNLACLQDAADPLPLSEIRPLLESAWKCPLEQVLQRIESRGRAASIGQVHLAILNDGREVAVKVQYPGIREAIHCDLRSLGWLSAPMGGLSRGFDLQGYRECLLEVLERELDYESELRTQEDMRSIATSHPLIAVPEPIREWCSRTVLVTQWLENKQLDAMLPSLNPAERRRLGEGLAHFFLDGLLNYGCMQADWHPGNVRLREGDNGLQWTLFDFGAPCRLAAATRIVLAELLTTKLDADSSWRILLSLGFDAKWLEPLRGKLADICRLLAEPFHSTADYDICGWKLSERMQAILGDDRWNFRIAAPPSLLPLMRAFHGLIYYLTKLSSPVNLRVLLDKTLSKTAFRPNGDLATASSLPNAGGPGQNTPSAVAQSLKVRVTRGGETVVQLSLPADAVQRLESLLDDDLIRRIQCQGIDVAQISASPQAQACRPGPLFSYHDEAKGIDVWLA